MSSHSKTPTRERSPYAPFDDTSLIRRVHADAIVLLGGGRALLMQLAHPSVAAGVAEHSSFQASPFKRLLRTLQPTLAIAYGNPEEVTAAARSINAVHERVVGSGYDARDPDLLFWVLATLIDSALVVHERFLRPLSQSDQQAYFEDMLLAGDLLGIDRTRSPADISAFRAYMDRMISTLEVTPMARKLASDIFGPPLGWTPAGPLLRQVTAGLLPPRLREQYRMSWGPRRERVLRAFCWLTARSMRRLPAAFRAHPWFLMPDSRRPAFLRRSRN